MQPLFIDFSAIHFCLLSYDVKYVITLFPSMFSFIVSLHQDTMNNLFVSSSSDIANLYTILAELEILNSHFRKVPDPTYPC